MKNRCILIFVIALAFTSQIINAEPLPIQFKTGIFMPSDSGFDSAYMTGIEAQFAVSNNTVFFVEYDKGTSQTFNASYPGSIQQTGSMNNDLAAVGLIRFQNGNTGMYYGAGVAYSTYNISTNFNVNGQLYHVDTKPSRVGGLFILGYRAKQRYFIETRYLYTGSKRWNPFIDESANLGGLILDAGYTFNFN